MLIAIPAAACGALPSSVLDLEPLLAYCRECRPDAVTMLPAPGADDQPNGPALLAMRHRLEQEGLRVLGGTWTVPPEAPVDDPAWRIEQLFGVRALAAALGEAGVSPLLLHWQAAAGGAGPLREFLHGVLEEAERGGVPIALRSALPGEEVTTLLAELNSSCLGICLDLGVELPVPTDGSLLAVVVPREAALPHGGRDPAPHLAALRAATYAGPLVLEGLASPVETAQAVGFLRGLLAAGA